MTFVLEPFPSLISFPAIQRDGQTISASSRTSSHHGRIRRVFRARSGLDIIKRLARDGIVKRSVLSAFELRLIRTHGARASNVVCLGMTRLCQRRLEIVNASIV